MAVNTDCTQATPRGLFYSGKSMRSTFRRGDYIYISPVPLSSLRVGDVVVFKPSSPNRTCDTLVHRIISIEEQRITTRGDNNLLPDRTSLTADSLVGKAMVFERNGRRKKIAHGFPGMLRARRIRMVMLAWKKVFLLLRPLYSILKRTRLVPALWKPDLQRVYLDSANGERVKYIHKGRTVLVRQGDRILFKRRPYDLLF